MNMKSPRAFRSFELLAIIAVTGLLTGCSDENFDMPAPQPHASVGSFDTAAVVTATAPEMTPPPGTFAPQMATAQPAIVSGETAATEVPLYNIAPDDLVKHPKWGPVLQLLSQSCVAFFAAEKRVPGSVAEMQAKGFVKDVPALPDGMMFQIDAENYRVRLVSM
jgi:hypothetical protein